MKKTVTRAEYARLCGTSRAGITLAIQAKRVITDDHGRVPVQNPANVEYIVAQRAKRGQDIAPRKAKKGKTTGGKGVSTSKRETERTPLIIQKLVAEIRLKNRQASSVLQRTEERRRQLVPVAVHRRWFGSLSGNLRAHLTDLPVRVTPQLLSLAQAGKASEMQELLEREINQSVERVLSLTDQETKDYLSANHR